MRIVHQLWFDPKSTTTELPLLAQASAQSILNNSECDLWLWSYRKQLRIHEKDANEILDQSMFTEYVNNSHHIMHVVDLFRFIALEKYGGYWMDSDTICLRALPNVERIFQTIPRRLSGVRVRHVPFFPNEKLGDPANSIFCVPKGDQLMRNMINYTLDALSTRGPLPSTQIVYEWGRQVAKLYPHNLASPMLFCPLPENTLPKQTQWQKFGWTVPSIEEIQTNSVALDFYGSAKRKYPTKWQRIINLIVNGKSCTSTCQEFYGTVCDFKAFNKALGTGAL